MKLRKRIPVIICLSFQVIYYILAISSLRDYEYVRGVGIGFKLWICAMLFALVSLLAHCTLIVDELLSHKSAFSVIKLILVIVGFPLYFLVGITSGVRNSIIWNVYFTIVFVFQLFSLFIRKQHNKCSDL